MPAYANVLDDYSEPEPDLALLTPREDFYKSSHPAARDLLLVVEIADSSLTYDRLYARSHLPEVWVVYLENRCVRVFQEPAGKGFARTRNLGYPYLLTPVRLAGCEIDLAQKRAEAEPQLAALKKECAGRGKDFGFLPVRASKQDLTAIIDRKTGEVLKVLAIDPWV